MLTNACRVALPDQLRQFQLVQRQGFQWRLAMDIGDVDKTIRHCAASWS
jgi:hypothetical protein